MKKFIGQTILCVVVLFTFVLSACEPTPDDILMRSFKINKGEHYSSPRILETLQSNQLVFTAMFDESAIYDLGSDALQSNKNKLLGISGCNSMHHENSARFAWQWYNGRLEIYAYCYVNSIRCEKYVGFVPLNTVNHYRIEIAETKYRFTLNNEAVVEIERGNNCDMGVYYMLWPYFGGSLPAPHDIHIDIRQYY
jgi:hypothetical protein